MKNHRHGCRLPALGAAFALAAIAIPARADDMAAAQALFDQAKKAVAAHDYAQACPKFEESLRLQEGVGTLLNLADCYEHEGKLASAWSRFLEVAAKARAAGQTQRVRIGHDRAAALAPKLSNLIIDVPPASRVLGLEVRRDGTPVGEAEWGATIPADAGPHTIEASAPGRKRWSETVAVAPEATTARTLVPELPLLPPPPEATSVAPPLPEPARPRPDGESTPGGAQRIGAIAAATVGVAGVAAGTVFGLLSLSRHNTVSNECSSTTCRTPSGLQASKDAMTFGNVSTITFIVGGVGLAAGITLFLTAPRATESHAPTAELRVGPGHVALLGTW
ncbi:MAG: hypothetical protein ABSC94_33165 [Polyangiaceae bacterium]